MKYKSILFIATLFCFQVLHAQESRTLTLQEAVDLSLKNSHKLKSNEAKILEATAKVKEAEEKKLPDASISGSYLYLPVKANINLKSGPGNGGGPSINQAIYGIANVSLPIYNGGKINYGIQSSKFLEQAVKLDAENDKETVTLNIISACINLYKAYQAIELVKENLHQSQQRVKDLSNMEKNGLLARNDLLKAELQSSNIELSLLDAESNYKIACVNMNIMMGLPEQTVLIPDKSGLALPTSVKNLEDYEQEALQNRKDIDAISFRKKSAGINLKSIKADKYPSLTLTGGYIAADVPKFLTVYNAVNIGVGIKYNIASLWKNKSKVQQAAANITQITEAENMLTDNIRLQVNQAYQAYMVSTMKIKVYEKAEQQATENYRIVKNKFDNTLATTTELLDADVALLQSKLSVTNAKADSFIAYNKLLQVTGTLKY